MILLQHVMSQERMDHTLFRQNFAVVEHSSIDVHLLLLVIRKQNEGKLFHTNLKKTCCQALCNKKMRLIYTNKGKQVPDVVSNLEVCREDGLSLLVNLSLGVVRHLWGLEEIEETVRFNLNDV